MNTDCNAQPLTKTAAIDTRAGQILSRLRTIAKKAWISYRDALTCEARVVAAIDVILNGSRPQHKGLRSVAVWDDVLDGGRRAHLFDLARLGHSHHPASLAAFDAALDILAAVRGRAVVDLQAPTVCPAEAISHTLAASADLASAHVMATSPSSPGGSSYTLEEARELRQKAKRLKEAADEADMAARRAEIQCIPGAVAGKGGR